MHIVYVCREYPPSLRGGGIASYIKEMAHGMAARGHQVTVVAASDDTRRASEEDDGGVRVLRLSGGDFVIPQVEGGSVWKKLRTLHRFYSYRRRVREAVLALKDADIVEVPEYGAEGWLLEDCGVPVVTRLHTPMLLDHNDCSLQRLTRSNAKYWWQGRKELTAMRRARYLTSCSASLKDWSCRYLGIAAEKIQVIHNPIQTDKWLTAPSAEHARGKDGRRHILFVGTVCDWKGCDDLAEACRLLAGRGTIGAFTLDLVGKTGAFAEGLREAYGQEPWFNLVGKLPREEVMRRYAEADVVCFPSWWENMPMVCIEAMLCGAMVVGSESGGMSEIIENGKSGFLLAPQQPAAWASKIEEVAGLSDEERTDITQAARERIETAFDISVIAAETEAYYAYAINDFRNNSEQ